MGLDLKLTWRYFPIFPGKNNKESKKNITITILLEFLALVGIPVFILLWQKNSNEFYKTIINLLHDWIFEPTSFSGFSLFSRKNPGCRWSRASKIWERTRFALMGRPGQFVETWRWKNKELHVFPQFTSSSSNTFVGQACSVRQYGWILAFVLNYRFLISNSSRSIETQNTTLLIQPSDFTLEFITYIKIYHFEPLPISYV